MKRDERTREMNSPHPANAPQSARISAALLILRIASAMAFLYHGSGILFGAFGGPGPQQFAAGHQWPVILAYLVGLAQLAGGLAILTGILFRVGALCIIAVMLGAIFLVHLPHGFNVAEGGAEYALTQLLLAIAFLFTGPGGYSLASRVAAEIVTDFA
jgi:putative oxidoreductase